MLLTLEEAPAVLLTLEDAAGAVVELRSEPGPGVSLIGPPGAQGPQGETGERGPQGETGPMGPAGGETYTHVQGAASALWTVAHNLGRHLSVTVVDSAGTVVEGDVRYIDSNTVEIAFSAGFSGKAHLN